MNSFLGFEYRWLPKGMPVSPPTDENLIQHNYEHVLASVKSDDTAVPVGSAMDTDEPISQTWYHRWESTFKIRQRRLERGERWKETPESQRNTVSQRNRVTEKHQFQWKHQSQGRRRSLKVAISISNILSQDIKSNRKFRKTNLSQIRKDL